MTNSIYDKAKKYAEFASLVSRVQKGTFAPIKSIQTQFLLFCFYLQNYTNFHRNILI